MQTIIVANETMHTRPTTIIGMLLTNRRELYNVIYFELEFASTYKIINLLLDLSSLI